MGTFFTNLVNFLTLLVNKVMVFLPDSPFDFGAIPPEVIATMAYVNYFIPVGMMLKTFAVWLGCVTVWYIYSLLLRWIKAIE